MSEQYDPGAHSPQDRNGGRDAGTSGAAGEAGGGAGGPGRGLRQRTAACWRAFRSSPFLPACVLVLIIAAAAGLFAGSYTYALANPTPRLIPTAVVGSPSASPGAEKQARAFVAGMEKALGSSLQLRRFHTYGQAVQAVQKQQVFGVLRVRSPPPSASSGPGSPGGGGARGGVARGAAVQLDVSSASGASVAQVLQQAGPKVGKAVGVAVTIKDLNPLAKGDPRGLVIFYISLAAVILGFVGAIQLSVHARALNPPERIAFTVAYALLGGFVITAMVSWLLGAVPLPFVHSWLILSATMFTSGMVFTMFNTLFGRWAMIPTWGLMVLLGNPSSGGAVSWPLLPSVLGRIGRWLPPGASVNAQHTAVYFTYQHLQPYLVLAAWAVLSCAVFWFWRHRHPGGRTTGTGTGPDREPGQGQGRGREPGSGGAQAAAPGG